MWKLIKILVLHFHNPRFVNPPFLHLSHTNFYNEDIDQMVYTSKILIAEDRLVYEMKSSMLVDPFMKKELRKQAEKGILLKHKKFLMNEYIKHYVIEYFHIKNY